PFIPVSSRRFPSPRRLTRRTWRRSAPGQSVCTFKSGVCRFSHPPPHRRNERMAPFQGPSREQLIAMLRARGAERKLPITLGRYAPQAVVEKQGGKWRLRELALDDAASNAYGAKQLEGGQNFMPENTWQFLAPDKVLLEHADLESFCRGLQELTWNFGP